MSTCPSCGTPTVRAEPIAAATLRVSRNALRRGDFGAMRWFPSTGWPSRCWPPRSRRTRRRKARNFGCVRTCRPTAWAPLVSCGPPIDGMRVRIVDSDGAQPDEGVGEIQDQWAVGDGRLPRVRRLGHQSAGGGTTPVIAGLIVPESFSLSAGQRDAHRARLKYAPVRRRAVDRELAQVGPGRKASRILHADDGRGRSRSSPSSRLVPRPPVSASRSGRRWPRGSARPRLLPRRHRAGAQDPIPRTTSGRFSASRPGDRYPDRTAAVDPLTTSPRRTAAGRSRCHPARRHIIGDRRAVDA